MTPFRLSLLSAAIVCSIAPSFADQTSPVYGIRDKTPNLLAFSNIIGIFLIIIFENKKIFSKIKLFVLLLGLFLTFSKMIVLFLGLIILFFTKSIKNKSFKALIIASSIFLMTFPRQSTK